MNIENAECLEDGWVSLEIECSENEENRINLCDILSALEKR